MFQSRRKFLKTAAASGTLAAVSATPAVAKQGHLKPDQIVARFAELHGDKAFKILAPAAVACDNIATSSRNSIHCRTCSSNSTRAITDFRAVRSVATKTDVTWERSV